VKAVEIVDIKPVIEVKPVIIPKSQQEECIGKQCPDSVPIPSQQLKKEDSLPEPVALIKQISWKEFQAQQVKSGIISEYFIGTKEIIHPVTIKNTGISNFPKGSYLKKCG